MRLQSLPRPCSVSCHSRTLQSQKYHTRKVFSKFVKCSCPAVICMQRSCNCYRSSPSFRCRRRSGCCPCLCNETLSIIIHHLRYDTWLVGFLIISLSCLRSYEPVCGWRSVSRVQLRSLMLTWRQLAAAACWVWCCAAAVSEGWLQQVETTFCLMELGNLLKGSKRSLVLSNEMTDLNN